MNSKDEKEMMEAFKQLSASGRVEALSYAKTVLKAESGIKKEYGLDKPSMSAKNKRRKAAVGA